MNFSNMFINFSSQLFTSQLFTVICGIMLIIIIHFLSTNTIDSKKENIITVSKAPYVSDDTISTTLVTDNKTVKSMGTLTNLSGDNWNYVFN